jgi:hypothetical protein
LSTLLCEALCDTAPIADSKKTGKLTKVNTSATYIAEEVLCKPRKSFAAGGTIEMRNAEKHKMLKMGNCTGRPAPILIIDEFYAASEENEEFVRTLLKDAAKSGICVFLITREPDWASKLITLNDGTKVKPLPINVDNEGYNGALRFQGDALWNELFWSVDELRELAKPMCEKMNLDVTEVVPDGSQLTPGEVIRLVVTMDYDKRLQALS